VRAGGEGKRLEVEGSPDRWAPPIGESERESRREEVEGGGSGRSGQVGPAGLIGTRGKRKGEKKRELGPVGEKRGREK
jgi:hypothetical protein